MIVTAERLRLLSADAHFAILQALAVVLEEALAAAGINTLLRRAHFLAQACWESQRFTRFEENLNYSAERIETVWPRLAPRASFLAHNPAALANAAYSNHNGNGNEASGDGWVYRGRGLFQLTGRRNYQQAAIGTKLGLILHPDQAAMPDGAVATAIWFWTVNGCNGHADHDDAAGVTRLINGPAEDGLAQRRQLTDKAKGIFTDAAAAA